VIKIKAANFLNKITKDDSRVTKIIINTISSIASKGVNLIINIVSVPLLLTYLGQERYGMFAMVTSLLGFMTFSDLGLGLGLQNRVPEYKLNADKTLIQKAISTTFFTLTGVSILLFFILYCGNFFIDWAKFYNVHSPIAINESSGVSWAFFFCFLITLPFNTVYSVLNGNQEGYVSEVWRSVGNVLCIILLFIAVKSQFSTPLLTAIMYGSLSITTFLAFFYIFGKTRPQWRPKLSLWRKEIVHILFKDGSIYFILQLFAIGLTTVDGFLIAQHLGSEKVTTFMVGLRLISIISLPLTLINGQILPALNDAIAKDENQWIKKILRKALWANTVYISIFGLLLCFLGNNIIKLWVGNTVKIDSPLWLGFIALFAFTVYNSLVSNILLSPKLLKYTIVAFPISVCLLVVTKWLLIVYWGLPAMVIGGSLLMLLIYILPTLFKFKKNNFL
jgi:O-antigen/teichoic acid export membrane protein